MKAEGTVGAPTCLMMYYEILKKPKTRIASIQVGHSLLWVCRAQDDLQHVHQVQDGLSHVG
jgi:hypothetical protein